MPIYEYQCRCCDKKFQSLVMKKEEEKELSCPECRSRDLKRLISRVVYHVSEGDRLANFDPDVSKGDSFYRDSRNIGLAAKKRAQQLGADLGSGFEEKLEKLRTDPGSVIRDAE
jgi:putative FmdB family regulatory protein